MCENCPFHLIEMLNSIGKATELYKSPDGSSVLILPYGGRVLGLYSSQSNENFFWTNAVLGNIETAKAFFDSDKWHNSGGHRTWLAPEVAFFFPKFPDFSEYYQPRQLDHSSYLITKCDSGVQLENQFSIRSFAAQRDIELKIVKSFSPALNPLRYINETGLGLDCEYAGYELAMKLEIIGGAESSDSVGLWDLVQVPHCGEVLIPTYQRTVPRCYFGEIITDNLRIDDHLLRYKIRDDDVFKFGIGAAAVTGRIGYLYQLDDIWNLIIRNFFVNPSGEYIDVPCNDLNASGDAVQVCSINSDIGSFSELEYHVTAIGKQARRNQCEDISQVWAFRGTADNIKRVANILIGIDHIFWFNSQKVGNLRCF